MQTRTRTAKCGCKYSETRDKDGTLLHTDESMCTEHLDQLWAKGTTASRMPVHTVHLSDEQQARMKELMEEPA